MDSFGSTLSSKSQTPSQSARSDITMGTVIGPELDQVSLRHCLQMCYAVTLPVCQSALPTPDASCASASGSWSDSTLFPSNRCTTSAC
jgi:hypothetical protein